LKSAKSKLNIIINILAYHRDSLRYINLNIFTNSGTSMGSLAVKLSNITIILILNIIWLICIWMSNKVVLKL
jgi:hypothetical protein